MRVTIFRILSRWSPSLCRDPEAVGGDDNALRGLIRDMPEIAAFDNSVVWMLEIVEIKEKP